MPQESSKYTIYAEEVKRRITVGYHGLIYAQAKLKTGGDDDKPYMVMRSP